MTNYPLTAYWITFVKRSFALLLLFLLLLFQTNPLPAQQPPAGNSADQNPTIGSRPEKSHTTLQEAERGQNFSGRLYVPLITNDDLTSTTSQTVSASSINAATGAMNTSYALTPNVCSEGQYMDLTSDTCRYLVKNFGFDAAQFDANFSGDEYTLGTCTESALQAILTQMGTVGGRVTLPACTIVINVGLNIPSNVIIEGAGIGQTIFESSATFSHNMFKAKYRSNVIIRDLSVDGRSVSGNSGILAWYADNVLIERVDVHHNGKSGIIFRYAKQVTIRYVESHDHVLWHGIDSKDCFPSDPAIPDSTECATQAGSTAPGVLWSEDYAAYSNRLYNNGRFGLNIHANNGEAAGNLVYDNVYGSKLPDAANVWIHHNEYKSNANWGSWVYNTVDAPEKIAHNIVYFENIFTENQEHPVYIDIPAYNIYLLHNQYNNNVPNRLRITPTTVYTCSGSQDASLPVDGNVPMLATASECDLEMVAHLFGFDPNATPGKVTQIGPSGTITSTATTFEWQPQLTATHYTIVVYDETNNTVLFYNDSAPYDATMICTGSDPAVDTCSAQPTVTLSSGINYRWLIQAWNNGISGPWSMYQ